MALRLCAIAAIFLLPSTLPAQSANPRADRTARVAPEDRAAARSSASKTCAEYGPDFVMVNGSKTCVRVGGALRIGVGGRAYNGR